MALLGRPTVKFLIAIDPAFRVVGVSESLIEERAQNMHTHQCYRDVTLVMTPDRRSVTVMWEKVPVSP